LYNVVFAVRRKRANFQCFQARRHGKSNIEKTELTDGSVCRGGYFYCPTMNSHRPKSQVTSKEQALIPEKEIRRTRKWPRCHVSLEKSSKNHKPLEK
jgi:hypothetical protein